MWIDEPEVFHSQREEKQWSEESLLSLRGLALVQCVVVPQTATGYIMMVNFMATKPAATAVCATKSLEL